MRWFVCNKTMEFLDYESAISYAIKQKTSTSIIYGNFEKAIVENYPISCFNCGSIEIKKDNDTWKCAGCNASWSYSNK